MFGISFCVTTSGRNIDVIDRLINNIQSLNIPNYEIIIVGGMQETFIVNQRVKHVSFDESIKPRWITRKKNLAVQHASYDNCIIIHDYILFEQNWYEEFVKFGTDWDICVHQCLSMKGNRTDGWRVGSYPGLPKYGMVPYDIYELTPFMAIQGQYICVKRGHFLKNPLDETLIDYDPSDMEWSARVVSKSVIKCNPNCIVRYGKNTDDTGWIYAYLQMLEHEPLFEKLRYSRIENWKLHENF